MTRREIREEIFKILFSLDFYEKDSQEEQIRLALAELQSGEEKKVPEKDYQYIHDKVLDILHSCQSIDQKINESADKWKTSRIGKAELTILRLAVYEIFQEDSISPAIAINEAVELAKKYGDDNAPKFVNGLLAKVL